MIEYLPANGEALDVLKKRLEAPIRAIPTPFKTWNESCHGFGGKVGLALGWHVLVAGSAGMGKSFTGLNIAAAAMNAGEAVTFHTLEMDRAELTLRIMAIISGVSAWRLMPGKNFDPLAYGAAREGMECCKGSLWVNDKPLYDLKDIRAATRRQLEEHGSRLQIYDYLQLAWDGDAGSRYDRITSVSHGIRQEAMDLRIVTVGLSQLNRTGSKGDTSPRIEDMDGGGPLEADAMQVLLLDHSRKTPIVDRNTGFNKGWLGWIELKKNRFGPGSVEIPIRFDADTFRIRERDEDEILHSEIRERKR